MKKGFTLVELAIVLVIIGIVLGGIIKGRSLINNSKARRLERDLRELEMAVWIFYDRYGRLPGDVNRDGAIDVEIESSPTNFDNNPASELSPSSGNDPDVPWAELKAARILPTSEDNRQLASTVFNGKIFIGNVHEDGDTTNYTYNAIGIMQVPCFAAKVVDRSIDGDINGTAGAVRILVADGKFANSTDDDYPNRCKSESTPINIVYIFDRIVQK